MSLEAGLEKYIKIVLGEKLKEFIARIDNNGLDSFLLKNNSDMKRPAGAEDNDLITSYAEYLIASAKAFQLLERPNLLKAQYSINYGEKVSNTFDKMLDANAMQASGET